MWTNLCTYMGVLLWHRMARSCSLSAADTPSQPVGPSAGGGDWLLQKPPCDILKLSTGLSSWAGSMYETDKWGEAFSESRLWRWTANAALTWCSFTRVHLLIGYIDTVCFRWSRTWSCKEKNVQSKRQTLTKPRGLRLTSLDADCSSLLVALKLCCPLSTFFLLNLISFFSLSNTNRFVKVKIIILATKKNEVIHHLLSPLGLDQGLCRRGDFLGLKAQIGLRKRGNIKNTENLMVTFREVSDLNKSETFNIK